MNTNLLIITIAFLPLVVILITYNIFFNKRVGVALRDLNRIFETERAKFVFAFGPRILFVHFTMHFAANKETLLFTIGVILTLLALIYIEESIIFALAMWLVLYFLKNI